MGIKRKVDKLGRIVLPMQYRKKLGIVTDDTVIVSLKNDTITVSPTKQLCSLCGRRDIFPSDLSVCSTCIRKIKEL